MAQEIDRANLRTGVIYDRHISEQAEIARTKFDQKELAFFAQKLSDLRVWDALATTLPATPASDDLGLVTGTYGTDAPQVQTGDLKAAGATTRRARMLVSLPDTYDDGSDARIRCVAGMKTTVADTAATIAVSAYRVDPDDGTLSADLITTAAQSINTLGLDAVDFTLDTTSLVAGDVLDVRVSIAVTDAATGTAVIGVLGHLAVVCDVRP